MATHPAPDPTIPPPFNRRDIAVLYAGGRDTDFADRAEYDTWAAEFFEMQMVVAATPALVSGKRTTANVPAVARLARRILKEWNKYDGFVVTLGQPTFLYEANLLATMLGPIGKPVVCTTVAAGPTEAAYSDMGLKANILNAVSGAAADVAGVVVALGSTLIPVQDVLQDTDTKGERYFPRPGAPVARLDFGLVVNQGVPVRSALRPVLDLTASPHIYYLNVRVNPAVQDTFQWPPARLPEPPQALIIDGGEHMKLSITKELPEVPVLLLSENAAFFYRAGQLTQVEGLTPAAAAARFTWLLGGNCAPDNLLSCLQPGGTT